MDKIIRDPLWNNIRVDPVALRLVDTNAFQRLRYIRQLGLAYLVYPGATHSRFEHALGAYHLARRALAMFEDLGFTREVGREQCVTVRCAALLHDIGHYPFSHALEEIGALHHEEVARPLITQGEVAAVLRSALGDDAPQRIMALIRGQSDSPLQGLISGSLDLDKIDYLSRDARMCGVPYGTVDVDRLLSTLTLVETGTGRFEVGVQEKGVSALESLLFAKYQMYRNVYWHHAVRSATCMFKRAVRQAVRRAEITPEAVAEATDDGLMELLITRDPRSLAAAIRSRRLFKRALDLPASDVPAEVQSWVTDDPSLLERVEDSVAVRVGLEPGELLLDFPARSSMLGVDLPLRTRGGTIERLTDAGRAGQLGLPRVADELYRSARRLRVFVASMPARSLDGLLELMTWPAEEVTRRMADEVSLV